MAIGPRDHIDHDDYSYTKARIQEINERYATAQADNAEENEMLRQTDTSLSVIDTPLPEKKVSNDKTSWVQQNTLSTVGSNYWYQISQFVPWQDSSAYYQSFSIQDTLQTGIAYKGNLQIIREEDQKDITSSFTTEYKNQILKVTPKSTLLAGKDFYGYHYVIRFQAGLNPVNLTPVYTQNKASYTVKNKASVRYRNTGDTTDT